MTTEIRMPAFSATMESAKLIAWHVEEGASVEKGQVLAEVETDKAVAEIESPVAGIVRRILVPASDEEVEVEVALIELSTDSSQPEPKPELATTPVDSAQSIEIDSGSRPAQTSDQRIAAAPAARRAAKDAGISLEDVTGTGPDGRITKQDVLVHTRSARSDQKAGKPGMPSSSRLAIARAMVQSKTTVPHFYTETDVIIDGLIQLKQEANSNNPDVRVTLTAFFILAVAKALGDVKEANNRWDNSSIVYKDTCDIGVAVDIGNSVVAPVIRNAGKMNALQIATRLSELVALARSGSLKQSDLGDASLTISNLGMFSIDRFYPIVNIPEPMIVGIGRARHAAVVVDNQVVIRNVVTVTLSLDHRVIDGAVAGRFADALQNHIENQETAASSGAEK